MELKSSSIKDSAINIKTVQSLIDKYIKEISEISIELKQAVYLMITAMTSIVTALVIGVWNTVDIIIATNENAEKSNLELTLLVIIISLIVLFIANKIILGLDKKRLFTLLIIHKIYLGYIDILKKQGVLLEVRHLVREAQLKDDNESVDIIVINGIVKINGEPKVVINERVAEHGLVNCMITGNYDALDELINDMISGELDKELNLNNLKKLVDKQ